MVPIEDWDETYVLNEVANAPESENFERKASASFGTTGPHKIEMAQEICAFANAGDGILAYGLNDAGGLDAGVPDKVGNQAVRAWAEALIPKLHHPPIENCLVRFVPISTMGPDRGVLAISVPLSDRRPHWSTQGPREIPYLRVGEHSAPMRLQTLLDITSRGSAPHGEIGSIEMGGQTCILPSPGITTFTVRIRVAGGPICRTWAVEIMLKTAIQNEDSFLPEIEDHRIIDDIESGGDHHSLFFRGNEVLFPGKWARVSRNLSLKQQVDVPRRLLVRLFMESAVPVQSEWRIERNEQSPGGFEFIPETSNKTSPIL